MTEEKDFLEEEILAAWLQNQTALAKALEEKVTPVFFSDPANRLLAQLLWQSYAAGKDYPPKKADLLDSLQKQAAPAGLAKASGWPDHLEAIGRRTVPIGPRLAVALDLLKARRHLSLLKDISRQITEFLEDDQKKEKTEAPRFSRDLINQLVEVAWPTARLSSLEEEMTKFYHAAEQGSVRSRPLTLDPPFPLLNGVLGGIKPGDCYLLLSAPQRGKTTLALSLAQALATNAKTPVLYVSWSQPATDLVLNLLVKESRIERQNLIAGPISPDSAAGKKLLKAEEKLGPWAEHLYFIEADDTTDLSEVELALRFLREKFPSGPAVLFLDALPDIPWPKTSPEEERLLSVTHAVQQLARHWELPVVLLSSLNRQGCQADQKDSPVQPSIYDLEGPVEMIYSCAECLLLRKNWPLTRVLQDKLSQKTGPARALPSPAVEVLELSLEKNRSGKVGRSSVQFLYAPAKNLFLEAAETGEAKKTEAETQLSPQISVFLKKLAAEENLLI